MATRQPASRIRLGLVGAGLFMGPHLKTMNGLEDLFEVVAVFSRTEASAQALLENELTPGLHYTTPTPPPIYTDLQQMLSEAALDAVDIALPIHAQPGAVRLALEAGLHVISEKPIAPTSAAARDLIALYEARTDPAQVWMVAENWRYGPSIQDAAQVVAEGKLGQIALASWHIFAGMTPDRPYYHTAWRRDGSHPGGLVLDGGVHFVAALRAILGEVVAVSAFGGLVREDLPPPDTVSVNLRFESGLIASLALSYAVNYPDVTALTVVGTEAVLQVNMNGYYLRDPRSGDKLESRATGGAGNGLPEQFEAFGVAVLQGVPHDNTPQQALQDLLVIEAILASYAQDGQPVSLS